MIRTQIQLTDKQFQALKRASANRNTSLADLIRQSVDLYLAQETVDESELRIKRATDIVGKYASDATDVSENHDKYLAELFLK